MKIDYEFSDLVPIVPCKPYEIQNYSIIDATSYIEIHACPFCNTLNVIKLYGMNIDAWVCTQCDIFFRQPTIYRIPEYESQI